jgi:hypothetical protein
MYVVYMYLIIYLSIYLGKMKTCMRKVDKGGLSNVLLPKSLSQQNLSGNIYLFIYQSIYFIIT